MKTLNRTIFRQLMTVKSALFVSLFGIMAFSSTSQAQTKVCNTGIEADVKANVHTFGSLSNASGSDDWFPGGSSSDTGKGLIDTTNAYYWYTKSGLSGASGNVAFAMKSAFPLWSTVNGKIYIAGGYSRDHLGVSNGNPDSTTYGSKAGVGSGKNGMSPANWQGTVGPMQGKNDIIDVYTAFRRDGKKLDSSLYLLGAVAIATNTGSRFFDFEYNQTLLKYSTSTTNFTGYGPQDGHTAWTFDANGNVTKVGDLILACEFNNSGLVGTPNLRIWVSRSDWNSVTPTGFSWNTTLGFDGPSGSSTYGYASVTVASSAVKSFVNTAAVDGPPWGAKDVSGVRATQYIANGLLEFSVNLSLIGVDPKTLPSFNDPCAPIFNSFMVKTRSSASFTSALMDFMHPIIFDIPSLKISSNTDTLHCNEPSLTLTSTTTNSTYYSSANITWNWTTTNGAISGSNTGSSVVITKPGTYVVGVSKFGGCPFDSKDTSIVPLDAAVPVATSTPTYDSIWRPDKPFVYLIGGDSAASVTATTGTFGGSKGIEFKWIAPDNNVYNQRIIAGNLQGDYTLVVNEKRNNCKDTAISTLIMLPVEMLYFNCDKAAKGNALNWGTASENGILRYEIYRSADGMKYNRISAVDATGNTNSGSTYTFVDEHPLEGTNHYKLRAVNMVGKAEMVTFCSRKGAKMAAVSTDFTINPNPVNTQILLNVRLDEEQEVGITVYSADGRVMFTRTTTVGAGVNTIILPANELKPGYYSLSVHTATNNYALPFIKTISAGN